MSQNIQKTKILLTGGHAATSALALIEEIQKSRKKWEIVWIGSQNAFSGEKATTLDFQLFPNMGVKCISITAGKLQRNVSLSTVIELLKMPVGFVQAFIALRNEKPKTILSFGGFVALPVVIAGKILSIPVLIHEQTVGAGLANKLSVPFANEVLLSREDSKKYFEGTKTQVVGLPIRKALEKAKRSLKSKPSSIYITGGSRGAKIINGTLKEVIPFLLKKYSIVHQTGSLDESEFQSYKKILPAKTRNKYQAYSHILPDEIPNVYKESDIVIGRAGAHTVAEVLALGKSAVFIPIPWVQMNEQYLNAKMAEKYMNSVIVKEKDLSTTTLLKAIEKVEENWKTTKNLINPISKMDWQATEKIVEVLTKYVL